MQPFRPVVNLGPLLPLPARARPNVMSCTECGVLFWRHGMSHHQAHCQAFQALSFGGFSCPLASLLAPSPPPVDLVWVLEVDPLSTFHLDFPQPHLYVWIPFTLWPKKCTLFFVCLWIALFETYLTLLLGIYFCFSLDGVLSSLPMVALLDIRTLEFGFGKKIREIGRSFKWNIFFKGKRLLQLYLWTKAPQCPCSLHIPLLTCPPRGNLGEAWL
jgi:hypothetical protein